MKDKGTEILFFAGISESKSVVIEEINNQRNGHRGLYEVGIEVLLNNRQLRE